VSVAERAGGTEFPLFEEPHQTTGEVTANGLAVIRVNGSCLTTLAPEQRLLDTGQMVDTVVLQRFVVVPGLIIDQRLFQRERRQFKRVLVNLHVVFQLDRILVPTSART